MKAFKVKNDKLQIQAETLHKTLGEKEDKMADLVENLQETEARLLQLETQADDSLPVMEAQCSADLEAKLRQENAELKEQVVSLKEAILKDSQLTEDLKG